MAKIIYRQMPTPRELSQQIPAPGQKKLGCKSPRVGQIFYANPRGCVGGWLWMKLIPALLDSQGLLGEWPDGKKVLRF